MVPQATRVLFVVVPFPTGPVKLVEEGNRTLVLPIPETFVVLNPVGLEEKLDTEVVDVLDKLDECVKLGKLSKTSG
jgi:hypothetical protein